MRITFVAVAVAALAAAAFAQNDWPTFGQNPAGTRYSTLKQIDAKNVTKLVRAWTYHMTVNAPAAAKPAMR
jgi:quinoprotein glucose dehydrogenase